MTEIYLHVLNSTCLNVTFIPLFQNKYYFCL